MALEVTRLSWVVLAHGLSCRSQLVTETGAMWEPSSLRYSGLLAGMPTITSLWVVGFVLAFLIE